MQEKDILNFIQTMINVASDFSITKIDKAEEQEKIVRIYFKYLPSVYKKKGDVNKVYKIYGDQTIAEAQAIYSATKYKPAPYYTRRRCSP